MKIFSNIMFRDFFYRSRPVLVASIALIALQPPSAQADQCDDAWASYQSGSPEMRSATAKTLPKLHSALTSAEERQRDKCDQETATDNLARLILSGAKKLEQACSGLGRHRLICNVTCQQNQLSESEKKTAYDCSPAALQEAKKAEQAEQDIKAASNVADQACANLSSTILVPIAGDDKREQIVTWVKMCNAHPRTEICKVTRDLVVENGGQLPPGFNCGDLAFVAPKPRPKDATPPPDERKPASTAELDCNSLATWVTMGAHPERIPQLAKNCNTDRTSCKSTRSFLVENNFSASMLTCDQ